MDYLTIVFVVLVALNIVVSIYLFNRDDLDSVQKFAQIVIVWIIPFVGAIGLWLFNLSQDSNNNKPSGGSFGGGSQDSIGVSSYGD